MPMTFTTLGHVLLHIYDFDFGAAIYLPDVVRYEPDTPCIVASSKTNSQDDWASIHAICLERGFKNWLNVAVVSDTFDGVSQKTESDLIEAFNEDCKEGGWLWKMMNYKSPECS